MEQRNSKLIIGMAGGTASASAKTYKISLPSSWVERLAVTEEDRELTLSFDGERIIIEKKKVFLPCILLYVYYLFSLYVMV